MKTDKLIENISVKRRILDLSSMGATVIGLGLAILVLIKDDWRGFDFSLNQFEKHGYTIGLAIIVFCFGLICKINILKRSS